MCTSGMGTWPKKALRARCSSTVLSLPMDQSMHTLPRERYASRRMWTLLASRVSSWFTAPPLRRPRPRRRRSRGSCAARSCSPHSRCSGSSHHQRPARQSSPSATARVHGAQPMLGKPWSWSGLYGTSWARMNSHTRASSQAASGLILTMSASWSHSADLDLLAGHALAAAQAADPGVQLQLRAPQRHDLAHLAAAVARLDAVAEEVDAVPVDHLLDLGGRREVRLDAQVVVLRRPVERS